jgi:DNA-binding SARP family transcriptional activator
MGYAPSQGTRPAGEPVTVCLFDGPVVTYGTESWHAPEVSNRLLAYMALRRRRLDRRAVSRTLWPDLSDRLASSRMRTALWRLRSSGIGLLAVSRGTVGLQPSVKVDVQVACEWASRLIDGSASADDLRWWRGNSDRFELLPGWHDDWLIFDRERIRQRMLHGLEALAHRLVDEGRAPEAVEPALAAVNVEPLRESAQRALVRAHVGEGNVVEARRAYDSYRSLLGRELGLEPSFGVADLIS